MAQIMPSIFPENAEIHHLIIDDYVQCFHLQEILEPRVFCDVLMFAVDKGTYVSTSYHKILDIF